MTRAEILTAIEAQQMIQQRNPPTSELWKEASDNLRHLGGMLAPIAGVWTPWADVLCRKCHDDLKTEFTVKHKIEWPAGEKRDGDGQGWCNQCGGAVWVREDVAQLTRLRALAGGEMEQTGGMCTALVKREESGTVVVTIDGEIWIGRYRLGEWEEGHEAAQAYCLPGATPDEAAAAVIAAAMAEKQETN